MSKGVLVLALALALSVVALVPVAHGQVDIDGLSTSKGLSSPFAINGDFSSGRLWPWRLHSSAMVSTAGVVDGRAEVTVGAEPTTQLWQKDITLHGDTTYVLMFDAMSSMGSNLRARVMRHGMPYESYGIKTNINIRTGMRTFTEVFRTTPGDKFDGRLSFLLSPFAQPGEVYTFDNIQLFKAATCGDGIVTPEDGETCEPSDLMSGGELVMDGSFEAGSPNPFWTEFSTNFGTTLCNPASCGVDLAADGEWWSWFGGIAAAEEGIASQPITIPAGATATLQFSLWLITCSDVDTDIFEVNVNGDTLFSVNLTDARCDNGDYSLEIVDVSSYAGQDIELEFRAVTGTTGANSNIFLDLISLEVLSDNICRDDCTYCGDGIVDDSEECDPADPMAPAGCSADCTLACPQLTLERQVSCNLGMTWSDSCVGTNDPGNPQVALRYAVSTSSGSELVDCVLTDSNGEVTSVPVELGNLETDLGLGLLYSTDALECSSDLAAGEPGTATLTCECLEAGSWSTTSATGGSSIQCEDPPPKGLKSRLRNPGARN